MILWQLKDEFDADKKAEIKAGIKYTWNHKIIWQTILLASGVTFFLAAYNLFLPYLNHLYQGQISNAYGKALIGESSGSILFSFLDNKKIYICSGIRQW